MCKQDEPRQPEQNSQVSGLSQAKIDKCCFNSKPYLCIAMSAKTTIAFHTLGCKLNYSETATISRNMPEYLYSRVGFDQVADIYVINSCTVTKNAEKRCRELIRKAKKINPGSQVVVVGCYAQIRSAKLANYPGVSLVLGNNEKFSLHDHLRNILEKSSPLNNGHPGKEYVCRSDSGQTARPEHANSLSGFVPSYSLEGRTRSFLKIQDGCDYLCAYCTIPLARGRSRSNTIAETLLVAEKIAASGIREVVLTGVNIGDFGKRHGETLCRLLKEMVKIDGLPRIRLSSVEPDLLHDELIQLIAAEPKLMPHVHMPLQSGSDQLLRAMGRRYDTALFSKKIDAIRQYMPHACIAVDLITGYPGETESVFRESCQYIEQAGISYMHVFTYSERENTRAASQDNMVHPAERKRRSEMLWQLSGEKMEAFLRDNHQLTTNVLWEKEQVGNHLFGYTENYIRVKTRYSVQKANTIEPVCLNTRDANGVYTI